MINVDKDFHIAWIKKLILVQKWLQFEKTQFLHALRCIYIKNFADDFDGASECVLYLVAVCSTWSAATDSLASTSSSL